MLAHMHEPCPGASIAVETAGQSDFLAILREAAQNRRALVEGAAHLQWANDFDKPCRVW